MTIQYGTDRPKPYSLSLLLSWPGFDRTFTPVICVPACWSFDNWATKSTCNYPRYIFPYYTPWLYCTLYWTCLKSTYINTLYLYINFMLFTCRKFSLLYSIIMVFYDSESFHFRHDNKINAIRSYWYITTLFNIAVGFHCLNPHRWNIFVINLLQERYTSTV